MVEASGGPAPDGSTQEPVARGPDGWENWQAFRRRLPYRGAFEVPIYTDSRITGEVSSLGPYRVLNTVPAAWRAEVGYSELAAVLTVDIHDDFEPSHTREDWETAEHGSYHGGTLGDEIAALIALRRAVVESSRPPASTDQPAPPPGRHVGRDRCPRRSAQPLGDGRPLHARD